VCRKPDHGKLKNGSVQKACSVRKRKSEGVPVSGTSSVRGHISEGMQKACLVGEHKGEGVRQTLSVGEHTNEGAR
jgi:hypothetical protein